MAIELSEKIRFYGKEALEERLNVATVAERNAIPLGERYNGMIVTVRAEGKRYELLYDGNFEELSGSAKDAFLADNDNWAESGSGSGTSETPESIKTKYESNEDTNAFTDADKLKLDGLQNETGQSIADKYEGHEDVKRFTTALKEKVDGIETNGDGTKYKSNDGTYKTIDALPSQTGNAGKVLKTNGTAASWEGLETSDINSLDTKLAGKESIANKGVAGGYAPLDASGMLPASMIPESVKSGVTYKGLWDATSGTPPHISPENGWYWRVSVPGTTDVDGNDEWELSDWIIWNGTAWDRIKNSDRITSVQGATSGDVVITDANVDHQIGITIPSWITAIYTAGKANIRSVFDAIVNQITIMKAKLDGIESGATKNRPDSELLHLPNSTGTLSGINKVAGLQEALGAKLSIRGDNFICTRPGSNKTENGTNLQNIINELASFTPGGNPLSHTNRAYVLVMPGEYSANLYLNSPYVDIIGFGSKNGIIINGNIETYFELNKDHRIENMTVKGDITCYGHTEVCVYRNLIVDTFWCDTLGVFENIEHSGIGDYLFEVLSGGTLKNIYTPKALGGYTSSEFNGIIEECRVEAQHYAIGLSGTVTRSYFKGSNAYDAIFDLYDGAEISYTTIINESDQETGTEWAVTNFKRYGAPDTDKEVRIHHCHFVAKDGALSPKVINTIANGHNTWDSEEGGGIEDIIAGTNISIDKTDPKNPVINASGGEGSGYKTPSEVRSALEELSGENRLSASAVKGLPIGVTSSEKSKIEKLPGDTNQEIADINSDLLMIGQDIANLEGEVEALKNEYVLDIDFEDAEPFKFKAPEAMKITSVEAESGTTPTITGYTVGNNMLKHATFTIEVDVPGMVTLKGEFL